MFLSEVLDTVRELKLTNVTVISIASNKSIFEQPGIPTDSMEKTRINDKLFQPFFHIFNSRVSEYKKSRLCVLDPWRTVLDHLYIRLRTFEHTHISSRIASYN